MTPTRNSHTPNNLREGTPDGDVETTRHIQGIGDATFLAKYRVLSTNADASLLAGLKLPTGSTNETSDAGERLEGDHQPGTGSWDPLMGAALTWRGEALSISASALYQLTTQGDRRFKAGDVLTISAGGQYQITSFGTYPRLWAALEVSYGFRQKDRSNGVYDDDSGGHVVWIAPGLRSEVFHGWTVFVSMPIPVYQALNGVQHQERFELLAGIGFDFRLFE